METTQYHEGDILIIAPVGKLDTLHAADFLKEVETALEKEPKGALLDLGGITFLSSSGLQSILAAAKISSKKGINFGVFGMQEMTYDVFTMSGFNRFIKSFTSKDEAVANLL